MAESPILVGTPFSFEQRNCSLPIRWLKPTFDRTGEQELDQPLIAPAFRSFQKIYALLDAADFHNLLPLLWETQPERFPLAGTVLDLADGVIVHSRYVEELARGAGYAGRLWRIPHPAWPETAVAPKRRLPRPPAATATALPPCCPGPRRLQRNRRLRAPP